MTTPLRVINPTKLLPANLVSTNVLEDDAPLWVAESSYASGALTIRGQSVYESAKDGNAGHDPATSPTWWTRMGNSNRWKPFDRSYESQCKRPGSIVFEFKPDEVCAAFATLNVAGATSLTVTMTHPDYGEVYRRDFDMAALPTEPDWWGWWFSERVAPSQSIATDLPSFPGATIRIEFSGGDDLSVGVILLGQVTEFGLGVKTGARLGIDDYSREERNGFGDLEIVERPWNKRGSFDVPLQWHEVDRMQNFIAKVRATPCLWIGSDRYEATTLYALVDSFDIVLSYYAYADCSLSFKGLT